jgi:hypothetical protein
MEIAFIVDPLDSLKTDNTRWHDTGTAENRRTLVTRARIIFRAGQGNRT